MGLIRDVVRKVSDGNIRCQKSGIRYKLVVPSVAWDFLFDKHTNLTSLSVGNVGVRKQLLKSRVRSQGSGILAQVSSVEDPYVRREYQVSGVRCQVSGMQKSAVRSKESGIRCQMLKKLKG